LACGAASRTGAAHPINPFPLTPVRAAPYGLASSACDPVPLLMICRGMTIKITPNDKGNPPGKLAEAELHFGDGPLEGLKLMGFSIWERRGGNGRNVTFPARSYVVDGDRRSFALLRPIVDSTAQAKLRDLILDAFQDYEERAAIAS
jgi:hypothetical protein